MIRALLNELVSSFITSALYYYREMPRSTCYPYAVDYTEQLSKMPIDPEREGGFAYVFKCSLKGKLVAVKQLRKSESLSLSDVSMPNLCFVHFTT